jgi:hypothetical protein
MKTLKHYLAESQKTYEFRLKTIVELSEDQLDKLETHLRKYDAYDIETPKRTIMQSAPLDFYNTGACEVFIIDFKTRLPLSPALLINELVPRLGISEGNIRVRNKLEPAEELDTIHREENSGETKKEKSKSILLDPDYKEVKNPKADEYHGEKHKTKFLRDLEKNKRVLTKEYKLKK